MFASIGKTLRLLLAHVFSIQCTSVRCISLAGERPLVLSREFLQGARQIQLAFTLRWLFFGRWLQDLLAFRLLDPHGEALTPATETEVCLRPNRGTVEVSITLPAAPAVQQRGFRLLVLRRADQHVLSQVDFSLLDGDTLLSELRVTQLVPLALCSTRRVPTLRFHDQVDQFSFGLRLELQDAEHRSLLDQMGAEIEAGLSTCEPRPRCLASWKQRLQFTDMAFAWSEQSPVTSQPFAGQPGEYALIVRLAQTALAVSQFRVVPFATYLQEVRLRTKRDAVLSALDFGAVNPRGQAEGLGVIAEDFRALTAQGVLEVPQPDPLLPTQELPLTLVLRFCENHTEVGRHTRSLSLNPGRNPFNVVLALTPELLRLGPGQYCAAVLLDDRLLEQHDFHHKTRRQLKAEKEQSILASLTTSDPCLFVLRDGERIQTNDVFETDEAIVPALTVQGSGFDADVPTVTWRLDSELVQLDSEWRSTEGATLRTQEGKNRYTNLEILLRTPDRTLRPGRYQLRLRKLGQTFTEYRFRILSVPDIRRYTEQQIIESLQARDQRLVVLCGNATHVTRASTCLLSLGLSVLNSLSKARGITASSPHCLRACSCGWSGTGRCLRYPTCRSL